MVETKTPPELDLTTPEGALAYREWGQKFPDLWIENLLNCSMWDIPRAIARSVFDRSGGQTKRTVCASCTSTSKSHTAARVGLAFLYTFYPSTVITTAPTFRQVESILWREIRAAWTGARYNMGGDIKLTSIHLEDNWFAIGLSTDEPERFQGLHNKYVLVIGDEASGLSPAVYAAMENPLAAGEFRSQLLIGNPTQPTGEFRDAYLNESGLWEVFHISCFDTPNFTEFGITIEDIRANTWREKIGDEPMPRPYLISPEWVYERFLEWGEHNFLFDCYCLGRFPQAGVTTLIPLWAIEQCMNAVIEPEGSLVASLDVSRYGDDETVFMMRKGKRIVLMETWMHQDNIFTAGRTANLIKQHKPIITRIDSTGVGSGVFDILEDNGLAVEEFNSSEKALDNEIFGNLRAELYFGLAQDLQDEELQIPNDSKLKAQLADVRYRYNKKNQLLIESKEEARSRGVRSPDRGDALMMLKKPVALSIMKKPRVKSFL